MAAEKNDAEFVLKSMLDKSLEALEQTVNQNPVLKKAGVIDAGGKGFCVILDAMHMALGGVETSYDNPVAGATVKTGANFASFETEDIKFAYCTEFIINLEPEKKLSHEKLRAYLDSLGDSLVFVEDDDIIKVHVHTNDPGKALQRALEYGTLSSIKIDNMREQHTEKVIITGMEPVLPGKRVVAEPEKKYGVVSVCAGEGLREVLKDIGSDEVVEGGQTMNPSTEDILRAIDKTPSEIVLVFPNNKNIIMAAEQCIAMSEKRVIVVPTKSVPEGIAALLSFDPALEPKQNRETMSVAIDNVRTGQITYAARDSMFDNKRIREGEYLAILDGDLVTNAKAMPQAVRKLAKELGKRPAEFVTVFYGMDVDKEDTKPVKEIFENEFKNAEINIIYGGQPVYHYLISVE